MVVVREMLVRVLVVWGRRVLRARVLLDTERCETRVALRTALATDADFKLCIVDELVSCLGKSSGYQCVLLLSLVLSSFLVQRRTSECGTVLEYNQTNEHRK